MWGDGGAVVEVLLELLADPESDEQERERLVRRFRAELTDLDLETVGPVPGASAPEGAKGADPVTLAAVVVALSASGGVFTSVIETVKDWLTRQSDRHRISITIDGDSIELAKATADQRQDLIDAFIRRHTAG
jgi:hypothetical protein